MLEDKIKLLKESEIGQLKFRADQAAKDGEDHLYEIELEIRARISKKNNRILNALKALIKSD